MKNYVAGIRRGFATRLISGQIIIPKRFWGPQKNRPKNHVFGGFRTFFERFRRFFEHGKPLGMIGDDFGRFDFRRFSLIFVGFRRVLVGFRGG